MQYSLNLLFVRMLPIYCGIILLLSHCSQAQTNTATAVKNIQKEIPMTTNEQTIDTAVFGAGCFWCVEAQFQALKGVTSVQSGYTGGTVENPTYEKVCKGTTGHAEAVRIVYNPSEITYEALLVAFFLSHDPTQLNRQGNDVGTQYRSAIFPKNEQEQQSAERYIEQLNEKIVFGKPIVTTIEPLQVFYEAEDYHNDYFANNPGNPYCQAVVKPKLEKFKEIFKGDIK